MEDILVDGPKHIGIILDGNRRWAKNKNMPAVYGHTKGADALEALVKFSNKIGLKFLTVYAFSTENWNRSKDEVDALMDIFNTYIDKFLNKVQRENVKIKVIGERHMLSDQLIKKIERVEEETKDNEGTCFNLAISYGGRQEILRSVKEIAKKVKTGLIEPENISLEDIQNNIYTSKDPNVDLIIRTSGEKRLSNFLMWQGAYAELHFIDKHWPDFTGDDLIEGINEFKRRTRRFGGN